MDREIIKSVFGSAGELYVPVILEFEADLPKYKYLPLSQVDIDKINITNPTLTEIAHGNQVVWKDQLSKAHLAAVTGILRGARWIRGMIQASEGENLLAFAASFRGLIEASSDMLDALKQIPYNLAINYPTIRKALAGDLHDKYRFSPEMEALTDHFIYARKQPKGYSGPKELRAKTSRDYIEVLQRADKGNIIECYSLLCELTHPASLTVSFLVEGKGQQLHIRKNRDGDYIRELSSEYAEAVEEALRAFNFAFMILKVINALPLPELATPIVDKIGFDNDPEWVQVKAAMK